MRYKKIMLLGLILIFFVTTAQRCTPTGSTINIAGSGTIIVSIPYEVEVIQDSSMCRGDPVIKQKGVYGEAEITYRMFLGDVVETSRKVKKEPITGITLVGTKDCGSVVKKDGGRTGTSNEVRPEPVTTPEVSPDPKCQETCPDKECGQGCTSNCGPGCQS